MNFLQSLGHQMVEYIVSPLIIWTFIALPVVLFLNRSESISPVYQYHSRIALFLALPLGIVGTYIAEVVGRAAEAASPTAFFVIQNPITITASAASKSAIDGLTTPAFWIGVLAILLAAGTLFLLLKVIANVRRLKKLEQDLHFAPLSQQETLVNNLSEISTSSEKVQIAYSEEAKIPFTYGWHQTKIVVPRALKKDPEALAMAVQHELMHIKHHDYLLNGLLLLVKSFFWYHPLTHHLYHSIGEYREINCDGEVLASNIFSKKKYASLLVDLAEKEHYTNLAMSMAVNPSSLKKRIQIMSTQNNLSSTFRSSLFVALSSMLIIVLVISCTDIEEGGVTNTEVSNAQTQLNQKTSGNNPLIVVNGDEWESTASNKSKIARLKPKYIKSMNVLKGKKATNKYGKSAEHGAVELNILNPDKALADLSDKTPKSNIQSDEEYFVAVEEMPELIGGLTGLQQKIKYPEEARKAGVEGRVIVRFIVNERGEVENPEIMKGVGSGLDEETIRVVKQAKFIPGKQRGEPVRVQYSLPITYKLPSEKG